MGKVGQTGEPIGHLGKVRPQGLLPHGQGAPVEWPVYTALARSRTSPDGF